MFSRRRACLAVGSSLIAPFALQACSVASSAGPTPAVELLLLQHSALRRLLAVFRRTALTLRINPAVVDSTALAAAADLFRGFGEDYHERALEEAFVFPKLQKAGGALAALAVTAQQQHERGRLLIGFIHDRCTGPQVAADQAEPVARGLEAMANMYEAHAAFEDTILYPAWEKSLTSLELKDMAQRFEGLQQNRFKADALPTALALIASIEQRLGAQDLASYTQPVPSDKPNETVPDSAISQGPPQPPRSPAGSSAPPARARRRRRAKGHG